MSSRIPVQPRASSHMVNLSQGPHWSHAEALEFEVARECITDSIAILTGELYADPPPSKDRAIAIRRSMLNLAERRDGLHVDESAEILKVQERFGAFVRAFRANSPAFVDLDKLNSL